MYGVTGCDSNAMGVDGWDWYIDDCQDAMDDDSARVVFSVHLVGWFTLLWREEW